MPVCEACNKNISVGVCSVPGVPYSAAYCAECLEADSHPMFLLLANTACCGGLQHSAPWWKEIVTRSLAHQGKTQEWFDAEVEQAIQQEKAQMEEWDRQEDAARSDTEDKAPENPA